MPTIEEARKKIMQNPLGYKIAKSPKILKQFVKIYKSICDDCRVKVLRYPNMSIDAYCKDCQEIIKPIMEKIEGLMKQ